MSPRTLDSMKPYPGVGNDAWPLLEQADQAAGRYLMHGAGLPDFSSHEGSLLLLEAIPRLGESRADHEKWTTALEAVATKYTLTVDEREAIEGGASCEAAEATFEGYVFGLAVGLRLADARNGGGQ